MVSSCDSTPTTTNRRYRVNSLSRFFFPVPVLSRDTCMGRLDQHFAYAKPRVSKDRYHAWLSPHHFDQRPPNIQSKCFHHSRINKIRRYLDSPSVTHVVNSLFPSLLEYNNSLFVGLHDDLLKHLQHVQNYAVRKVPNICPVRTCPRAPQVSWLVTNSW